MNLQLNTKPAGMFDVSAVRSEFEILSRQVYGKPLIYLDSAASAQKPRSVLAAMTEFAGSEYANVHRGVHYLSAMATKRYEDARETVCRFVSAAHTDEIVFTKGGSEAINLVAYSYLAPRIEPGDEIVLSIMEHHSNIVPWHFLRERQGAVLRWVDVGDDGTLDAEAVDAAIGPKTKFVAVAHMSNVLGTISPLREIVRRAHAKNVPLLADGCQAAVHERVDVQDLDADFYAFSGHKLFGPTGIGVLYGKTDLLNAMPPYQGGGDMIRTVTFEKTTYNDLPYKFEAGTPDIAGGIGLGAAVDYVNQVGIENIGAYEHELLLYGTEALSAIPGLRIIGTAREKAAVISFVMEGIHPHDIGTVLDRMGIAVRTGHHCAQPVMDRYQIPATTRASFAFYNTTAEIDALVAGLDKVKEIFS